jgi:hypothetical protein
LVVVVLEGEVGEREVDGVKQRNYSRRRQHVRLPLGILPYFNRIICFSSLSHGGKSRLKDWIIRVRDGKYVHGMNI